MIQSKASLSTSFKNQMAKASAAAIRSSFIYTYDILHRGDHGVRSPIEVKESQYFKLNVLFSEKIHFYKH